MIRPVMSSTAIEMPLVTRSATTRPASTEAREVGSERNRSIRPLPMSSHNPSAVTNPPKSMFWTRMPGMRKSTYSS